MLKLFFLLPYDPSTKSVRFEVDIYGLLTFLGFFEWLYSQNWVYQQDYEQILMDNVRLNLTK